MTVKVPSPSASSPTTDGQSPPNQTDTVLLTGGSGFIGGYLTKALLRRRKTVVATYRHTPATSKDGVYPVCSDLSSPTALVSPLQGVGSVIHLAWDGFVTEQSNTDRRASDNISALSNVLQAMEMAATRRIIFVSALGASRNAKTHT